MVEMKVARLVGRKVVMRVASLVLYAAALLAVRRVYMKGNEMVDMKEQRGVVLMDVKKVEMMVD